MLVGDQDYLADQISQAAKALSSVGSALVVHRGVNLISDEHREHAIGQDLA